MSFFLKWLWLQNSNSVLMKLEFVQCQKNNYLQCWEAAIVVLINS